MASDQQRGNDVTVDVGDDFVATVEMHRPPDNYFDRELIEELADAFQALDADPGCRAIVLCAEGKHFCAGARLGGGQGLDGGPLALYAQAVRLFEVMTPVIAAVHGAAIGGGLGLACSADFRVGCPGSRFAANFARLGFHHGFGLTVTLPAIVGQQRSLDLLYTGRRIGGEEALRIGLCDRIVPAGQVRDAAHAMAGQIAGSAPLAVRSIKQTLRGHLADRVREATDREAAEQERLSRTADWSEGVRAVTDRREPRFEGR